MRRTRTPSPRRRLSGDDVRNRDRHTSRRSRDHSGGRTNHNSNDRHQTSRDGLRIRDRRDSHNTEVHRSRTRVRRELHSRDRSRSAHRVQSRSHSRTVSPIEARSSNDRARRAHKTTVVTRTPDKIAPRQQSTQSSTRCSEASTLANALIQAIKTMQPSRSQHYYVSNFDPLINDIEAWCEEVDRAREANGWNDHECLSRVATCLKGDAKVWLGEWVSNDRTWSNFKREFKPLCPGKVDYANILFEAMNATSDEYSSYAEYARRTLLRLRIVQGLSDDLITLIVIRGIDNAQVHAAAANASLTPDTIVSFLSIYTKPSTRKQDRVVEHKKHIQVTKSGSTPGPRCFNCNKHGHVSRVCSQPKSNVSSSRSPHVSSDATSNTQPSSSNTCTFCKKPGHTEDKCFMKAKSEQRNQRT